MKKPALGAGLGNFFRGPDGTRPGWCKCFLNNMLRG
jgi:hypothetical protein